MGGTGAETAGDDIEALEAKMRATSAASNHGIRKRPARAMKDLTVQPIAKRPAKAQASQLTCEGAVDFDDLIKVDGGAEQKTLKQFTSRAFHGAKTRALAVGMSEDEARQVARAAYAAAKDAYNEYWG